MKTLQAQIKSYLEFCEYQKKLDSKTIRAYRIDLNQFANRINSNTIEEITPLQIENMIIKFHKKYKPKTVRRKIASIKAFYHYLEYREIIEKNPFNKIQVKFREPIVLPKTIPLHTIESFLLTIYKQRSTASTTFQKRNALRDAAVAELLFSTGIRISELCLLSPADIDLFDKTILIHGKGNKERILQIGNNDVNNILLEYKENFKYEIEKCNHFFVNQSGNPLSDQAVRRMINKYTKLAAIEQHITPHMFRHTFATCLLEADVDIRYIQEMLGHSSINITQIYTHVAMSKQKDILTTKHPRKDFHI